MSLLLNVTDNRIEEMAERIFKLQFAREDKLEDEYNDYRKSMMFRDIKYNLKILEVAVRYDAEDIFQDYALWLLKLLTSRMEDLSSGRVREQMISHYQIMAEVLREEFDWDYQEKVQVYLENAIRVTKKAELKEERKEELERERKVELEEDVEEEPGEEVAGEVSREESSAFADSEESELKRLQFRYLNSLLRADKYKARQVIEEALNQDISLEKIYLKVFQQSLIRAGELWHSGEITVDEEHYVTGMIQNNMMQLWPRIFAGEKTGQKLLACTIGNELHEMGVRILCDLMELRGWNSIYLGAAVPVDSILSALKKHKPDLVALSVTMPFYLEQCEEAVRRIKARSEFEDIRVAVGGRAFNLAPGLPDKWGVDVMAANAGELAEWAEENI